MKLVFEKELGFEKYSCVESGDKKYHNVDVIDLATGEKFQFGATEYAAVKAASLTPGSTHTFKVKVDKNYSESQKRWYTFINVFEII